jgi:hypothetical protein
MDFIKTNNFRPNKDGNSNLFGLNSFGSDSTICYTEVDGTVGIWRFIHFKCGTNSVREAIYVNKEGTIRKFDLTDNNIASRAIRLE